MDNFLARMNAKRIISSLVLALAMTACSSKQAVEGEDLSSEVQAEEDMMLGEDSGEVTANDSLDENSLGEDSLGADLGTPTAEIISSGSPSLPQPGVWKGSLKSQYVPGMSQWTVGRGESLSLIAEAVYGSARDYKKLMALNPEITDANNLSVGQKLRLPGSDGVAQTEQFEEPVAATTTAPEQPSAPAAPAQNEMPTVANNEAPSTDATAPVEAVAPEAPADAAMGVVDNAANSADAGLGGLVQRVDMGSSKLKLRNILLGVAAFFLLLSGVIFVLSRRKAKAG